MTGKKFTCLVTIGALLLCTFASCAGNTAGTTPENTNSADTTDTVQSAATQAQDTTGETIEIRFPWWGNTNRNEKYDELMDMFEAAYPDIRVIREPSSWDDYWTKMATQTAGGNPPDVLMFTQGQLSEYVARDAVLPLDDYVNSGFIDLSEFSQTAIDNGKYLDKIYVVTKGLSAPALFVNVDMLERAGAPLPPSEMTWASFQDYLQQIAPLLGSNLQGVKAYPLLDTAHSDQGLESFLRQRRKMLFSEDGASLGFDKPDLTAWFQYWSDLRALELVPSAEIQAEWYNLQWEQGVLANHVVAIEMRASNHLKVLQSHMEDEVSLWRIPVGGEGEEKYGEILLTASLGISSYSKHPDAVATLINYWCNDDAFNQLYEHEHGIVGNQRILESMEMDSSDRKTVDHLAQVLATIKPQSQRPPGQTPIITQLEKSWQAYYFGEVSLETAVDQVFAEAERTLS